MTNRALRWGTTPPATDEEAQDRLLDSAERSFDRLGIDRTRMDDIAREAGVHRTTVYSYFPNKDALVAAVFLREATSVLHSAVGHFEDPVPFTEQLVRTCASALRGVREARHLPVLLAPDVAGQTIRAIGASTAFQDLVAELLDGPVRAAVAAGKVRNDVNPEDTVRWIVRMCLSLGADPPALGQQDSEQVLRAFLIPSISP